MPSKRTYYLVLWLLYGLTILHAYSFYSLLPDTIGNKYDFDGTVTRLDSKQVVIGLYMFISCFPLLLFFVISRIPLKNSNFPNRDYWLKEENMHKARKIFTRNLFKFSVAFMLFWISVFHQIFQAGLNNNQMDNLPMYITFGLFTVFLIYWMINLFQGFRIPEDRGNQENNNNRL